jgi:16S rRNA (guanine527-N7)-methyltransferase
MGAGWPSPPTVLGTGTFDTPQESTLSATRDTPSECLERGLTELGLHSTLEQRHYLIQFINLLVRWNQSYNLTAVRDPMEMVTRHLLDSLAVTPYLLSSPVLDLGTGPGLPGIPLAIIQPASRFVLLDSNGKKIRFVRQAAMELGLTARVEVIQARMESYRPREKFATIVSRAVAELEALWQASAPLLTTPGRLLIMKGRRPEAELTALSAPHPLCHRLTVPGLDADRHLIEIRRD